MEISIEIRRLKGKSDIVRFSHTHRVLHLVSNPLSMVADDVSEDTLDKLRSRKGFPYVQLTRTNRVYLAEDIHFWLEQNRVKQ